MPEDVSYFVSFPCYPIETAKTNTGIGVLCNGLWIWAQRDAEDSKFYTSEGVEIPIGHLECWAELDSMLPKPDLGNGGNEQSATAVASPMPDLENGANPAAQKANSLPTDTGGSNSPIPLPKWTSLDMAESLFRDHPVPWTHTHEAPEDAKDEIDAAYRSEPVVRDANGWIVFDTASMEHLGPYGRMLFADLLLWASAAASGTAAQADSGINHPVSPGEANEDSAAMKEGN